MDEEQPIALEAYEELAERYSALAERKAENGYMEHPAMRAALGGVRGLSVLDAGCGPGLLAAYLLAGGAAVTGFDISPKMIELARRRNGAAARFFVADMARDIPGLGEGEFDVVASSLAMDYVRDWRAPLAAFRRALKPGGRLVFTVQHPISSYVFYRPPSATGVHLVSAEWRGFGGRPVTVPDYYRSFEEMVNPLAAAGFVLERVSDVKPAPELKSSDPVAFERYSREPIFMLIEARRGGGL